MPPRILIASLGATLRGDDGFGPRLLARVAPKLPPWARARDFGTHGLALVQALYERFDALLLLDACHRGGRPGTVYVLHPVAAELAVAPGAHLTGIPHIVALAATLQVLPPAVWLVGCEPGRTDGYTLRLSRPVRRALPRAERVVAELVATLQT